MPRLGAARFRLLESHFGGDLTRAWNAAGRELRASGIGGKVAQSVIAARDTIDPEQELDRLERAGVAALTWHDDGYPPRLKETPDAPPVLYARGSLLPKDEKAVAVVGTRRPTEYGRRVTAELCASLAKRGITVVSGLALGIDAWAHSSALDAGGRTVAVMGNGLDSVYPRENGKLAERIVDSGGALVSEFALGVRPEASHFPRRNRIISGMTLGTLVTEASETSGTRWTVYHALEQNREIFCVPGSIYSESSKLTNRLIREGAKLVTEVGDILVEIGLADSPIQLPLGGEYDAEAGDAKDSSDGISSKIPIAAPGNDDALGHATNLFDNNVDEEEADLLRHLATEPKHIDDLVRASDQPISIVSGILTMLELKGLVQQTGSMHYQRSI